jgi:PilZ domain
MIEELRNAGPLERRVHTRHRARTKVYIKPEVGQMRLCQAVNLSATGVAIKTDNMGLRLGSQVLLIFVINLDKVQKLHRRIATVCYVKHGQTGFHMETAR